VLFIAALIAILAKYRQQIQQVCGINIAIAIDVFRTLATIVATIVVEICQVVIIAGSRIGTARK
jgi:hypothetical protein